MGRFADAIVAEPGASLIAECKRRSPWDGRVIDVDPAAFAHWAVDELGAVAVSVHVTERFGGSLDHLAAVRSAVDVPILAKGVYGAEAVPGLAEAGADAVLAVIGWTPNPLEVTRAAWDHGAEVVTEGHTDYQLWVAGRLGDVVAVNARDLRTGALDPFRHAAARPVLPRNRRPWVAASGLGSWITPAGYDATLVGTSLTQRYAIATSAA